jgi:hypothetical protein
MGHLCRVAVSVLALMVLHPTWATCEENLALQALDRIKVGLGQGISYRELDELLNEARVQVGMLTEHKGNDCFRAAAKESYYWYDLGRKAWETMRKNTQQRDKYFRQAKYGEHQMSAIHMTMAENYDKLVKHARDALPTKWEHGNAALERARRCLAQ